MDAIPVKSEYEGSWSTDARIAAIVMSAFALFAPLGLSVTSDISGEVSILVFAVAWGVLVMISGSDDLEEFEFRLGFHPNTEKQNKQ